MGSTVKSPQNHFESQYRLIRKYYSEFYQSEITIIEHKDTKKLFAHRQIVHQSIPISALHKNIEKRLLTNHRNTISLKNYWIEQQNLFCSNMNKVRMIFEYHQKDFQQYLRDKIVRQQRFQDEQIYNFTKQMHDVLVFMKKNDQCHLLRGPKSVSVCEQEPETETMKSQSDEEQIKNFSFLREKSNKKNVKLRHRASLINLRINRTFQPKEINNQENKSKKNLRPFIKVFDNFQGLTEKKSLYSLSTYMEVPLHPKIKPPKSIYDQNTLSQEMISLQNYFTTIILALCMNELCEPFELDIFKNRKVNQDMIKAKIEQIRMICPRTGIILKKIFGICFKECKEIRFSICEDFKIKEMQPYFKRRRSAINLDNKENGPFNLIKETKIIPISKMNRSISRKKLSIIRG